MLVSLQIVRYSSAVSSFHPRYSSDNQCRAAKFRINCCTRPVSVQEPPPPVTSVGDDNRKLETGGNSGAGVQVPRRRYISVSKSRLLDSIVSTMFSEEEDEDCDFRALSECLDSILHAEHKSILEEMRADFDQTSPMKSDEGDLDDLASLLRKFAASSEGFGSVMDDDGDFNPDWRLLLDSSLRTVTRNPTKEPRVMIPVRFQHAFMQLLRNAEFEELSPMDLMLSSALNTDYLLTLPIYVDWKKASESGAIVFRRGYATERQKGLLIAEKLDYLQSKLLQIFFLFLAKPVGNFGLWLNEVIRSIRHENDTESLANKFSLWLKELPISLRQISFNEELSDDLQEYDFFLGSHPIWVASQKAVSRYEGIFSAFGPRERLLRKFLTWTGLVPSTPQQSFDIDHNTAGSESHFRPSFLSRISLGDIWKPASAKSCENDLRRMFGAAVSILFTQSVLQEPAFQELIMIYTEEMEGKETADKSEVSSLRMKIYEKIPIPDLPVVFPHKKLSFRIIDTVRLDVTTILGLLAYFLSYKFEDILSSPSAIPLDVIAATALVIYVSRVLLGYKQTRDRYQLLVNKTLYEKTIASGFGSIHFLLDASEQQLFKEAILAYAVLLKSEGSQVTSTRTIGDKCEKFLYNVFQEKIEMPFDKAVETLERLGLVTHKVVDGQFLLQAIPCGRAHMILKNRWNSLIS